jgi:hypothetical protein
MGGGLLHGDGDGPNQDAHGTFTSQAEPAAADNEQTRGARLQHLDAATCPDAEFRHATNPTRFAADVCHVAPFTGLKILQRQ